MKIHYVAAEKTGMIDAHTHGLDKYGSLELQFVLAYPPNIVSSILNELGERIKKGLILNNDDIVNVSVLTCDLKIKRTVDAFGEPIFRIIVPDKNLRWPENSDEYPYSEQYKTPYIRGN